MDGDLKLEDTIDFSDLEAKYATSPDDGLETFVVVDGCPVIPQSKIGALTKVLRKLFSNVGTIKEDGFFMPVDDSGKTKGFAFVEYETPQEAQAAVATYHNKKLDQKHTLLVNKLGDVERFGFKGKVSQEYAEPHIDEFKPREHLRSWLGDPQARDQMVLHKGDFVGIYWNKKSDPPEQVVNRLHWTEKYVKWSPLGTYLVSIHRQGVQIWGGQSWTGMGKFPHPDVRMVDFSPNENFLVTWSAEPITLPPLGDPARNHIPFKEKDEGNSIVVWDAKTFLPLRTFPLNAGGRPQHSQRGAAAEKEKKIVWPMFKWSSDSKYFARVIPGEALAIYEAPSMGLLDKKPIKIPGIVDFEFAPAAVKLEGRKAEEQLICYWTPEMPNQTARVSIMSLPSKEVVRNRNLFNVSGCRLHWQDEGRFLCVKVDRHTKTRKSTFTNLEFFRIKEKDIPVEVVELKETVINFQWEPKSDRFVLVSFHDQGPMAGPPVNRNIVCFYALERNKGTKGTWKLLKRLEKKNTNSIYWSPKGRFVVTTITGISGACELDFYDFDHEGVEQIDKDLPCNLVAIRTAEHYGMTDLSWDPSGRYVATSSSVWRHTIENGYKLWDFRGGLLREEGIDKFKAFVWRPRPPSILSEEKKKEIQKNFKQYSRRFDEEDAMEASEISRELITRRRAALAEWKQWRETVEAKLLEQGYKVESQITVDDEGDEVIEEIREEVLEEKEEVVE